MNTLEIIENKVKEIGRGYFCNFNDEGKNMHHINGYNHFVFAIKEGKIHPLSGGGSVYCYANDFTLEEFLLELDKIMIPSPYATATETETTEATTNKPNKPMTTKEEIIDTFSQYNDDANSRWEDEKILELCNYKEDGDTTELTVSIGKDDTTFHDLVVDSEGIAIKQQSDNNPLIEDVIHYILNPIFFGN